MILVANTFVAVTARVAGNRGIIVGGQPAPRGRYPWMVGQLSTWNGRPYCEGALSAALTSVRIVLELR